MITPANHNFIILVAGESGRQHGYEDRWDEGGSRFLYYGEGQIFDMRLSKRTLRSEVTSQPAKMCIFSVEALEDRQLRRLSLDDLRKRALADSAESRSASERKASYRYRSRAVRMCVLRRANGRCESRKTAAPFTTVADEPYLEPHHIRRLTRGGPCDPRWVIAGCPNCHRRATTQRTVPNSTTSLAKSWQG
jgi:5-methylcytosine-specific restriction enzyme A